MKTLMILCLLMVTSICYSQEPKKLIYNPETLDVETNPEWVEWKISQDPGWLQRQSKRFQKQWMEYQKEDSTKQEVQKDFKAHSAVSYELKMHSTKMRVGYAFETVGLALFGTSLILEWDNIKKAEDLNTDALTKPGTIYTLKAAACGLALVGIIIQIESFSNLKRAGIKLTANQDGIGIAIPLTKK